MKLLIGRPTWTICDSHLAMPVSLEIVVASSSMRAPRASPMRDRYLARSSTGVADHESNAALAAGDGAVDVGGGAGGIVAITSSVTESMTSMVSVESDGVQAPSMYSFSNAVMAADTRHAPSSVGTGLTRGSPLAERAAAQHRHAGDPVLVGRAGRRRLGRRARGPRGDRPAGGRRRALDRSPRRADRAASVGSAWRSASCSSSSWSACWASARTASSRGPTARSAP